MWLQDRITWRLRGKSKNLRISFFITNTNRWIFVNFSSSRVKCGLFTQKKKEKKKKKKEGKMWS